MGPSIGIKDQLANLSRPVWSCSTCSEIFATSDNVSFNVGRRPTLVASKLRFSYSEFAIGDISISLLFVCLMAFVTVWLSDGFESYYCSPTEQTGCTLETFLQHLFNANTWTHALWISNTPFYGSEPEFSIQCPQVSEFPENASGMCASLI